MIQHLEKRVPMLLVHVGVLARITMRIITDAAFSMYTKTLCNYIQIQGRYTPCAVACGGVLEVGEVYPPLAAGEEYLPAVHWHLDKVAVSGEPLNAFVHEHLGTGCMQEHAPSKVNASPGFFKQQMTES